MKFLDKISVSKEILENMPKNNKKIRCHIKEYRRIKRRIYKHKMNCLMRLNEDIAKNRKICIKPRNQ